MTDDQINKFIDYIQQNNYAPEFLEYNNYIFKKLVMLKKSFLMPNILVAFMNVSFSSGKDILEDVEEFNKQVNNDNPLIVIPIVSMESELKDNFWCNENIFAHIVIHNEKTNSLSFEKNFYYLGANKIKKIINLLSNSIN